MPDKKTDDYTDTVVEGAKKILADSDMMRAYWESGHSHFWRRSIERTTSAVGRWIIIAILSGAAGALIVHAVRAGWIK